MAACNLWAIALTLPSGAAEMNDSNRPDEGCPIVVRALFQAELHLFHRFPDVRLARVDVALRRVPVGVAGRDV